jgi:hypothetical protein
LITLTRLLKVNNEEGPHCVIFSIFTRCMYSHLSSTSSRPALGPTQSHIRCVRGALSPGVKRLGHKCSASVKYISVMLRQIRIRSRSSHTRLPIRINEFLFM